MVTKQIVITEDWEFDDVEGCEAVVTSREIADTLRHIADLIDKGYTSGHYPNWYIEEVKNAEAKD